MIHQHLGLIIVERKNIFGKGPTYARYIEKVIDVKVIKQ